jgi:transposase
MLGRRPARTTGTPSTTTLPHETWVPWTATTSVGHGRKSDPDDAVSVAVAAHSAPALRQVGVEDQAVILHLLTKRRQDLVAARTQTINRLHRLLMDLVPGGARRNLTAKRAAALLAAVRPVGQAAFTRHELPADLIADVRQLE